MGIWGSSGLIWIAGFVDYTIRIFQLIQISWQAPERTGYFCVVFFLDLLGISHLKEMTCCVECHAVLLLVLINRVSRSLKWVWCGLLLLFVGEVWAQLKEETEGPSVTSSWSLQLLQKQSSHCWSCPQQCQHLCFSLAFKTVFVFESWLLGMVNDCVLPNWSSFACDLVCSLILNASLQS